MNVFYSEQPPARQKTTPENPLRFVRATPNLNGMAGAELFLLTGNATLGRVDHIDADPAWNLAQSSATSRTTPFRLRVLHFNDLHGSLCRVTNRGEQPIMARMVSLVRVLRRRYQDNPNVAVMFVAGGDEQAGSFFDELLEHDEVVLKTHAGYRAYSAAGVDGDVIGTGFEVVVQVVIRPADHQVGIEVGVRDDPADGLDELRPVGNVLHKVAVHHVEVQPVGTGGQRPVALVAELRPVRGQQGRGDDPSGEVGHLLALGWGCGGRNYLASRREPEVAPTPRNRDFAWYPWQRGLIGRLSHDERRSPTTTRRFP